jgi:hypothetical protein
MKNWFLHLIVLFPSFDFNFIVDLRCGVSVFYGCWFSSVFPAVPVLVLRKGFVARSFFASDFVCRATPSRAQVSDFPSRDFDMSCSTASVCLSPSYLGAPLGTAGPRPLTSAISRSTSLARATLIFSLAWISSLAWVSSCVDLLFVAETFSVADLVPSACWSE